MRDVQPEGEEFRGDLIALDSYLEGDCSEVGIGPLSLITCDGTKENNFKLHKGMFR